MQPSEYSIGFEIFKMNIRLLNSILGAKGVKWLGVAVLASLSLAFLEYGIAGFLQLFLMSLGYIDPALVPKWLAPLKSVSVTGLSLLLVAIGSLRAFSLFLAAYATEFVHELLSVRLRLATIYEMHLHPDSGFLPAAEIQTRIGELFPKARHFMFSAVNLFVIMTQAAVLFFAMILTAWKEWLVGMMGLGLAAALVTLCNRAAARHANVVPDIQKKLSQGIERSSRNWLFIRISRTQKLEYDRLVSYVIDYFSAVIRASEFVNLMLGLPPLFGIILFAFIIFLSRAVFFTAPSALIIFLYLFLRLVQHLGNGAREWGQCTTYREQFRQALKIFFVLPDQARAVALLPYPGDHGFFRTARRDVAKKAPRINHSEESLGDPARAPTLRFHHVTFSYRPSEMPVISDAHFEIRSGEIAGFTGPSGSGKSTLLLLALGMLEPTSGHIQIDSLSPAEYFSRFSHRLGYVGAEPFLMEGSLTENLLYGNAGVTPSETEIFTVLEQVGLRDVITSLPGQLNYRLDENGSGLSTGQKQRIALARALLRRPALLVLDEASANLDNATESEIADTISKLKGQTTVLIVSHRLGILEPTTIIANLNSGQVRFKKTFPS